MSSRTKPQSLVYPTDQAARLIHPDLSARTMERWRTKGTGPRFVKVGRRVGYREEDIRDYLQRQTRGHTAAEKGRRTHKEAVKA